LSEVPTLEPLEESPVVESLGELGSVALEPLEELGSPVVVLPEELGSAALEPLEELGSPVVESLGELGSVALEPLEELGSPVVVLPEELGSAALEPLEELGSPVVESPVEELPETSEAGTKPCEVSISLWDGVDIFRSENSATSVSGEFDR